MARTTAPKAPNAHAPTPPPVDDTNAVLRIVRANGSSFTIGKPCAAAIVAICLAVILARAGADPAVNSAVLKVLRLVVP
jgi:hypothetical protein